MSTARLLLAVPLLAGCATVVGSEATDAEASAVTGVIVVEQTTGTGGPHAEVSARFVKVHGPIDDASLRLAGAQLVMPAAGECSLLVDEPLRPSRVELLSAGTLEVESASGKSTLQPRRLPDVTDLVSGVLYTARTEQVHGKVRVRAAGAEPDVAPLVVEATAPAELTGVRVAGVEPKGAEAVSLGSSRVELTWDAGSPADLVYVDVLATGAPTTRCAFSDQGHGALTLSSQNGTMVVHRLHREPLVGFERGELRFDVARIFAFTR